jgi:hypothetical protein
MLSKQHLLSAFKWINFKSDDYYMFQNSLAICLLAIVSIAPASNAFTLDRLPSKIPAENLYAQVKVNIGIGIGQEPYPQPQTRERVIVVERNTQTTYYDDDRSRQSEWRGRKEGWRKHYKHARHHHRDRDDD